MQGENRDFSAVIGIILATCIRFLVSYSFVSLILYFFLCPTMQTINGPNGGINQPVDYVLAGSQVANWQLLTYHQLPNCLLSNLKLLN